MNIDECLAALRKYDEQCLHMLPRAYYDEVASHWFHVIAPDKTREYGTECWERLGPRGFVVNMSAMRYRWTQLVRNLRPKDDPAMFNCLVDAFGFAMLFNLCLGVSKLELDHVGVLPRTDDEWIIKNLWEDSAPALDYDLRMETGMRALRMAYNMWRAV